MSDVAFEFSFMEVAIMVGMYFLWTLLNSFNDKRGFAAPASRIDMARDISNLLVGHALQIIDRLDGRRDGKVAGLPIPAELEIVKRGVVEELISKFGPMLLSLMTEPVPKQDEEPEDVQI
uniref:Uncharacterized protein n=1 Tax=viral metagenome TaxID=1070528 RepID=A0A2V0R9R3_9ZZZZ